MNIYEQLLQDASDCDIRVHESFDLNGESNSPSKIDGIYMAIFLGIPLCNWLYKKLEPKISTVHNKISHKEENK